MYCYTTSPFLRITMSVYLGRCEPFTGYVDCLRSSSTGSSQTWWHLPHCFLIFSLYFTELFKLGQFGASAYDKVGIGEWGHQPISN